MHLNDLKLRALTTPDGKQRDVADDSFPGFTVRIGKRTKTFMLVTGTGPDRKRYTIGRYDPPTFTLSMAREAAKNLLAERRLAPATKKLSPTYSDALATFYATHSSQRHRERTRKEVERIHERHFKVLDHRRLDEIETGEIISILDGLLATPFEANNAFGTIRTFFRWAVKRRLLERSPMEGLDRPATTAPRSRVLTPFELVQVWQACEKLTHFGPLVRCLILTGQRRGQFSRLQGEMIDREKQTITWPADFMKGRRTHTIPYGSVMAQLIEKMPTSGLCLPTSMGGNFTVSSVGKEMLDKACPVRGYTLHDLRRSWATIAAEELDVAPHIIEAVLAHQSGTAVARIYNRARYLEPMRDAMIRFETYLASLLQKAQHPSA